jgi:SEC-C motif domain protein
MRCPCRKKSDTKTYDDCCQPYHVGARAAPTAEALMRSSYSAFALDNTAYLSATWHPTTRPAEIQLTPVQEWVLLRILATQEDGDSATVEFIAHSRITGNIHKLREVSCFVREGGRWQYIDGQIK